jgi:putative tryptophan/tyrosine transport system substrate-binding protein
MIRLAIACLAIVLSMGGAQSQMAGRVYRLGVLALNPQSVERVQALTVPELAKRGFIEGQNLVVESRVGDVEQLPDLVKDLLTLHPDAILAINSTAVAAVLARTRTLPIIMFGGDPVAQGFAASLARPEGNITGITIASKELDTKRLDLLHETVPEARRIAVLVHPTSPGLEARKQEMRAAAAGAGVTLSFVEGPEPQGYGSAVAAARANGAQALAINADSRFNRDAALLTRIALENGLPTVCEWGEMANEGCLIGYGPILADLYRRTAYYIERIFQGAAPGQTPIEGPSRLRLVVNAKTARALGIKVPEMLLLQADEVIE